MSEDKITIAVIENDRNYRNYLVNYVKELSFVGEVLEFEMAEVFWREGLKKKPGMVLIDIHLPGMSGIELAGIMNLKYPDITKVVITNLDMEEKIFEALKYGCSGYILKSELEGISSTLQAIRDGGAFMSPSIALRVMQNFQAQSSNEKKIETLSDREHQVLLELVSGRDPQAIAGLLHVTIYTVRHHIKNIYKKLGVNNRQKMMIRARELGFY